MNDYNKKYEVNMANTFGVNETIKSTIGFYFGDPCYVMSEEDYHELLDQMFDDKSTERVGKFTVDGHELIVDNTAYGDGTYSGWNDSYPVDAGMLGVIPLELVKKLNPISMGWFCKEAGKVKMVTDDTGRFSVIVNGLKVEHVETGVEDDEWEDDED